MFEISDSQLTADAAAGVVPVAREVEQEEAAFFRTNGWVHLPQLISAEAAEGMRRWLEERAAPGQESKAGSGTSSGQAMNWFSKYQMPSREDELFAQFVRSPRLGGAGAKLLGRSVRFWADTALIKRKGEEGETPWHQDVPNQPHDRRGLLTIWIALVDIGPEKGSMRFLNGSHHEGPLGRDLGETSLVDKYPHVLQDYEQSPPLTLRAGDATAHDGYVCHAAQPNSTDDPRWAYAISLMDAQTRYTGYPPSWVADGKGIDPGQRFEHADFPVIG